MKKLLVLLLAFGLFAVACGDDADEPDDAPPESIVSLSSTATEILFAIGAGGQVVAVDTFSNYPEDVPASGLEAFSPNVESIAAFEPDLVIISFDPGDVVAALEALGVKTIVQSAAATIDGAYVQIEELGAATGRDAEAADLIAEMRTELDDLVAGAPSGAGLTYYHELDNTLFSITGSTFAGEIYALFGLENIADPADSDGASFGYPQLNDEFLIDANPDLVFLADTICCGQNAETVASRPGWDQMTAVLSGNVIELDDDIASRWGPRIIEFAGAIADALADVV